MCSFHSLFYSIYYYFYALASDYNTNMIPITWRCWSTNLISRKSWSLLKLTEASNLSVHLLTSIISNHPLCKRHNVLAILSYGLSNWLLDSFTDETIISHFLTKLIFDVQIISRWSYDLLQRCRWWFFCCMSWRQP